ncbi:serine/threonine-protein kinase [Streptomyces sp. NPDC058424]|uniref:serine/threonine-protein kinase n=1 Tax=Streptomyces sp. NPDC058424 TaxID=3346491 RepID=UPI003652069F
MLLADRYELEDLLGRGAVGEVWRASDQMLGRPVAVKLLRAGERTDTARFRREAQIAACLNHPNVVSMYDFGSHGDQLYLVMELVDGWSLAQERALRGSLAPHEASGIAAQIAAGLSAAHRQGVVYRDIKPANVMLTPDRTVKIADFGIARFADEEASTLTATGKILGTADYLAPERALGRPAQTASDVYSLGCVLYELLTGRPPFSGATSLAVVQQHVGAAPPPPALLWGDIPQSLSDYLLQLLSKEPAQRPTATQAADWLSTTGLTPPPAQSPGTAALPAVTAPTGRLTVASVYSSRGRRRARSTALLGGAAAALFAAAAALGASLNSDGTSPSAPQPPAPAAVPTTPLTDTPSSVTAPTRTPPAQPHGDAGYHDHRGKEGKGGGRGEDSDD